MRKLRRQDLLRYQMLLPLGVGFDHQRAILVAHVLRSLVQVALEHRRRQFCGVVPEDQRIVGKVPSIVFEACCKSVDLKVRVRGLLVALGAS